MLGAIGLVTFFLLLGFITIASILVCIAQADKGDPRASCVVDPIPQEILLVE